MTAAVLQAFSDLLRYPGDGRAAKLPDWIDVIRVAAPKVEANLEGLRDYALAHDDGDLEEVFVRTFENNSERALELGWHLHGENYARGGFMARMRGVMRQLDIEESVELPDHVSHLLSIVACAEPVLARALARTVVAPGLTKIEAGFADTENPYFGVLTALHAYIDEHYPDNGVPARPAAAAAGPTRVPTAVPSSWPADPSEAGPMDGFGCRAMDDFEDGGPGGSPCGPPDASAFGHEDPTR